MSDKPILFSGAMVRAILDGRKTQTRRLLKLPTKAYSGGPIYERKDMGGWEPTTIGGSGCFSISKDGERIPEPEMVGIWHRTCGVCLAAKWQAGDRLWVRETWQTHCDMDCISPGDLPHDASIQYPATYDGWVSKRRPSIFMPRWASRITLDVKAIRVDLLQDISEADAISEGAFKGKATGRVFNNVTEMRLGGPEWRNARDWYADLWDKINGAGSWDANPWVVAIEFQRVKP